MYKFINARVLTMDEYCPLIDKCCLTVENGIISYCGKDDIKGDYEIIDVKGDILMPGLINCHSHLGMSLFRGTAEGTNLTDWLKYQIFPMEKKLEPEDVYYGTMLSIAESVRGGVSTIADSYYYNQACVIAAKNSNINMVLLGADMDIDKDKDEILIKIENDYNDYNKYNNISYIPGCHSVYTCSQGLIEDIADFAAKVKSKTYIHLSETLKEVGDCTTEHNGLTPPEFLHKCGYFDNGGIAAHCVHIDKDDILLLKQSNVNVVHCPASNLKLGSGIAPVYSMLYYGLNVCLGTDSSASNNRLDMFREMYLASVLQKGVMNKAEAISVNDILQMATLNGANALGLEKSGKIKKGYNADIIRLSLKESHFYPKNNLTDNFIYNVMSSDIKMTMCRGKILYNNGNYYIGEDIEKIYSECEKRIKRLKNII